MNQYDSSTEVCVYVLFLSKLAVTIVTKAIIIIIIIAITMNKWTLA